MKADRFYSLSSLTQTLHASAARGGVRSSPLQLSQPLQLSLSSQSTSSSGSGCTAGYVPHRPARSHHTPPRQHPVGKMYYLPAMTVTIVIQANYTSHTQSLTELLTCKLSHQFGAQHLGLGHVVVNTPINFKYCLLFCFFTLNE